jgi:hypothetical protein
MATERNPRAPPVSPCSTHNPFLGCMCICQDICSSEFPVTLYEHLPCGREGNQTAAVVTVRKAILERFPAGMERRAWRKGRRRSSWFVGPYLHIEPSPSGVCSIASRQ